MGQKLPRFIQDTLRSFTYASKMSTFAKKIQNFLSSATIQELLCRNGSGLFCFGSRPLNGGYFTISGHSGVAGLLILLCL